MLIEDGRTGNIAQVNSEGMLICRTTMESVESHHADHHGLAFFCGNGMVTTDGTDNTVLVMRNDSQTQGMYIHSFFYSASIAGGYVSVLKGATGQSGGTVGGFANTNFSKNIIAPGSAWYGDDITLTGGTPIVGGFTDLGFTEFSLGGTVILGYGDYIAMNINAPAGAASIGVRLWFHGDH